jgi:hypothetical protein
VSVGGAASGAGSCSDRSTEAVTLLQKQESCRSAQRSRVSCLEASGRRFDPCRAHFPVPTVGPSVADRCRQARAARRIRPATRRAKRLYWAESASLAVEQAHTPECRRVVATRAPDTTECRQAVSSTARKRRAAATRCRMTAASRLVGITSSAVDHRRRDPSSRPAAGPGR